MNSITIDRSILESFAGDKFDRFHAFIDYAVLKCEGKSLSYRELATRWGWQPTGTAFRLIQMFEKKLPPIGTVGGTPNGTVNGTPNTAPLVQVSVASGTPNGTPNGTVGGTVSTENGVSSQYNNARLTYLLKKHSTDKEPNPISDDLYNGSLSSECKEVAKKTPDRNKIPPTEEMVAAYCKERNSTVDPEEFVDFYTSKNWMIGKDKMKDWQASVRTWERDPRRKRKAVRPAPGSTVKPNQFNTGIQERGTIDWDEFARQYDAVWPTLKKG